MCIVYNMCLMAHKLKKKLFVRRKILDMYEYTLYYIPTGNAILLSISNQENTISDTSRVNVLKDANISV